ncbi:MAG: fatty acid desaturase [Gammaproteobacteria bacterium]|jgi:alkane 1-monooxygenase|nr:fatty acid desaturase [Gammaproteobacteria bacterium]MDG1247956.1 fatty acid desaturase [SAR86 cluster bacterium]MDG1948880.1 fatty acid desaturase [SAR86 cluster bacterium]MDG2092500.1 fatty acid desaturase [SAR86 cluster bacterium]|tara:strand:+ start:2370 stop:3521 length:1152 start_codon:yes stop_codon:yes gene_type:complete
MKFFINARYLIVPVSSLITIFGIFLGSTYAWTGVILFGFYTIIDTLTKDIHLKAEVDNDGNSYGIKIFQYLVMYVMLPVFIAIQIFLAWRLYQYTSGATLQNLSLGLIEYQNGISGLNLVGAIISSGLWAGLGIIYGHELSHNKKEGFFVSRLIMALSGASHFTYAHVYNHHLDLGHEDDPATAPRGRNVYLHTWLSHAGQSKFSFDMEAKKLKNQGKSFVNKDNRWLLGYLYSLPSIFLFVWSGGVIGLLALATVWILSNFLLEALNFMGHYGLIRKDGAVEHRHSWDNDSVFTSWFFIEIGRQCDHHVRGETYFWELDDVGGPNYGIGYFSLFVLTLYPPLFRKFVQKHLDNWDKNYATEEERSIASKFNIDTSSLASIAS